MLKLSTYGRFHTAQNYEASMTDKDLLEQMLKNYEQPEDLPDYAGRYPNLNNFAEL